MAHHRRQLRERVDELAREFTSKLHTPLSEASGRQAMESHIDKGLASIQGRYKGHKPLVWVVPSEDGGKTIVARFDRSPISTYTPISLVSRRASNAQN